MIIRAARYRRCARYLCHFTVFCTAIVTLAIVVLSRSYRR